MILPPLLLKSLEDAGKPLTRIQVLPQDSTDERWLQELLYTHPNLLPVREFGESYFPAVPVGREVATERGPIDNLYISPDGGITVVETKLWKNPDMHRTVVAQVIDYAKELATWDYDQLCEAVLASSRKRNELAASLEEKVATELKAAGVAVHEFQESVAASLANGSFLLLIVGDRISPNIALLTKSIQGAPGLEFTLGLAEMQLFRLHAEDQWPLIVVPEVVGRTVEKTRGVVHVRYVQERPAISIEVEDIADGVSIPAKKLDLDMFLEQIPKDLVPAYREAIEAWRELGGRMQFSNKMMFFEKEFDGQHHRVVRCRQDRVNVLRRKVVGEWGLNTAMFDGYRDMLSASPVLGEHVREDKMWVDYNKLSADDLRLLLRGARELVEQANSILGP